MSAYAILFLIIPEVQLPTAGKTISARGKSISAKRVLHFAGKKTGTKIRKSQFGPRGIERFVDKLTYRNLSITVREVISLIARMRMLLT